MFIWNVFGRAWFICWFYNFFPLPHGNPSSSPMFHLLLEANFSCSWDNCVFRSIDFQHVKKPSTQNNWWSHNPLSQREAGQFNILQAKMIALGELWDWFSLRDDVWNGEQHYSSQRRPGHDGSIYLVFSIYISSANRFLEIAQQINSPFFFILQKTSHLN